MNPAASGGGAPRRGRRRTSTRAAWAMAIFVGLTPTTAVAINGQRERVQPVFENVQCLTRVDRAVDPVVHLEYSIAREDLEVDPIDVPSGRRHQFLALARQRVDSLPFWIRWADVTEAAQAGLIVESAVTDDDVFETSPRWPETTWVRITPDEPRVPISFAAAMAGIDWDTSGVPRGPWQVLGYTWDPERNEHRLRDGLIMVVDGDADAPPGGHVIVDESLVYEGEEVRLRACVDAPPGSTWSIAVGEMIPEVEPAWRTIDDATFEGDGVDGRGDLDVRFEVPWDLGGNPGIDYRVRLRVEDPQGRTYDAHALRRLEILDAGDPPADGDGGETGGDDGPGVGSCACSAGGAPGVVAWLSLLAWRRRRPRR